MGRVRGSLEAKFDSSGEIMSIVPKVVDQPPLDIVVNVEVSQLQIYAALSVILASMTSRCNS